MRLTKENQEVKIEDIIFSKLSLMDDFGRIFFYKNKVYRLINPDKVKWCIELLRSDLFKELLEEKVIPESKISDLKVEGYELILEHEKLIQTYKQEWPFDMLRFAALTILKVNRICNKYGYELKDGHFYNVLFKGTSPMWVDIGSIEKKKGEVWVAYQEFLNTAVIPLYFLSINERFIAMKLLESIMVDLKTLPLQSFEESLLNKLINKSRERHFLFKFRHFRLFKTKKLLKPLETATLKFNSVFRKITRRKSVLFSYDDLNKKKSRLTDLFPYDDIEEYIQKLPLPSRKSQWEGYHKKYWDKTISGKDGYRFQRIISIVKPIKDINTITDLAGNEGYFSKLLWTELRPQRILTLDYDSNAINLSYNYFRSHNDWNITPLMINFMLTQDFENTPKRLKSDLVLALAVTHHLILTAKFGLDTVLRKIRSYSNRYVLIEFMPLGLWSSDYPDVFPPLPAWYTTEWFRSNFKSYFDLLLEEQTEKNRILFFGKIIDREIK